MRVAKRVLLSLLVVGLCAAIPSAVFSARQPFKTKVLVVLNEDAAVSGFASQAVSDERMLQGMDARRVDRGLLGYAQWLGQNHGFQPEMVASTVIKAFAAELTAAQIQALEDQPEVAYLEADQLFFANVQTLPWGINRVDADISSTLAGNGSGSVTNVNVYVVDTGVGAHPDINRVAHMNFTGDGNNNDCNGHGTHVAGTIAARDNTSDVVGVVPGAPVTGIKVLGCNGSGSTTNIVRALDWITANGRRPAVVNMSLGGGVSTALDSAVRRSAAAGFVYALAAGNSGANACNSSPARAGAGTNNGIITTAATDSSNREASFSNFGRCVDVWGPGVAVLSTRLGGGTVSFSGTSMASPHSAGVAALFLSRNTSASPATVESRVKTDTLSFGTVSKDGRAIRILNARNF